MVYGYQVAWLVHKIGRLDRMFLEMNCESCVCSCSAADSEASAQSGVQPLIFESNQINYCSSPSITVRGLQITVGVTEFSRKTIRQECGNEF